MKASRMAIAGLAVLAMLAPGAARAGRAHSIVAACELHDGVVHFDGGIGLVPQERSVTGSARFDCVFSVDGGAPEQVGATLHMGRYHEAPSGLIGCSASVFTGLAVIVLDRPLPGGITAILDRFEAVSQGPSFWHHGAFVEVGRIVAGEWVSDGATVAPSDATGEYVVAVDDPSQCATGDLTTLTFAGVAAGVLGY